MSGRLHVALHRQQSCACVSKLGEGHRAADRRNGNATRISGPRDRAGPFPKRLLSISNASGIAAKTLRGARFLFRAGGGKVFPTSPPGEIQDGHCHLEGPPLEEPCLEAPWQTGKLEFSSLQVASWQRFAARKKFATPRTWQTGKLYADVAGGVAGNCVRVRAVQSNWPLRSLREALSEPHLRHRHRLERNPHHRHGPVSLDPGACKANHQAKPAKLICNFNSSE